MSEPSLDELLDRLNAGDASAAEQVFSTYEPFLRVLVSRQLRPALRSKFDSMDVVQSVFADVLAGMSNAGWHFEDTSRLEAFLVRLTRNRFLDRCRKFRPALRLEEPLSADSSTIGVADPSPRPSEIARRDELWERMLALCPPNHHELLRLKRQGLTLAEIADRTGLHPSSVRRIIHNLALRVTSGDEGPAV